MEIKWCWRRIEIITDFEKSFTKSETYEKEMERSENKYTWTAVLEIFY